MKKNDLYILLIVILSSCATDFVQENALYAYSESRKEVVLVGTWATEFCDEFNQEREYNLEFEELLDCKYELIRFAQEQNKIGNPYFESKTFVLGSGPSISSGRDDSSGKFSLFLADILKEAIIAYPEAKRKAEIEQRRLNNAYRKGVSDGRVQCQGSNC
jgi:hypothetical protein